MKNKIIYASMLMLLIFTLTGCGNSAVDSNSHEDALRVVCTIFPQYDYIREIAGDNVNVTLLMDSGVDMHSYQPSASDITEILSCDILIYAGGESDEWVEEVLSRDEAKNVIAISMLELIGDAAVEEEAVEGMEIERESEEEIEYDEHVWLSLRNAIIICDGITEVLSEEDKANANIYESNNNVYTDRLEELDAEYERVVEDASCRAIVVADRFPFRYMAEDYGISYSAAFSGCSAQSEASFETIVYLAAQVDEIGTDKIIVTETSDKSIAETVIANTVNKDQQIYVLNSLQSITTADIDSSITYYQVMEDNLTVLRTVLN